MMDDPEKALEILLPNSMEAPNNAQMTYEIARAYVKTGNVVEGEEWVNRLSAIAPMARETKALQSQVEAMKRDSTDG